MVFINLHWKDGHYGKTGAFCKRKYSSISLYNQAIGVIYYHIACQEAAMVPDIRTYYQLSEKVSNRKYLLKVAQTV